MKVGARIAIRDTLEVVEFRKSFKNGNVLVWNSRLGVVRYHKSQLRHCCGCPKGHKHKPRKPKEAQGVTDMSAQMVLFGEQDAAPYGYKSNGKARRRPVKTFEWPIFEMTADEVPEVAPEKDSPMYELYRQHRAWERIKARRCAELQAEWTPREEAARRGVNDETMEMDEMVEV